MNKLAWMAALAVLMMTTESCHLWRYASVHHEPLKNGKPVASTTADTALAVTHTAVAADTIAHTTAPADAGNQQLKDVLALLYNRSTTYSTFSGKAKVHFEGKGDKQDFTANIRMERGKKIWVSITALGLFEAARALITPDSIIVIDRIHHEVRALPFADAGKLLPVSVDFNTLQEVIIGDALHINQPVLAAHAQAGALLGDLSLGNVTERQNVAYARDTALSGQLLFDTAHHAILDIKYADYSAAPARRFASTRTMKMEDKGDQYSVDMDFSKADFDEALDFSFSVPAKYTRK